MQHYSKDLQRRAMRLWAQGRTWPEIAARLGAPRAALMRWKRDDKPEDWRVYRAGLRAAGKLNKPEPKSEKRASLPPGLVKDAFDQLTQINKSAFEAWQTITHAALDLIAKKRKRGKLDGYELARLGDTIRGADELARKSVSQNLNDAKELAEHRAKLLLLGANEDAAPIGTVELVITEVPAEQPDEQHDFRNDGPLAGP